VPPISTLRPEEFEGHGRDASERMPEVKGYTLIRKIGEGGMGAVYEAIQKKPNRRVALKILRPGLMSKSMIKRFGFETETLARLEHPLISRLYEVGTIENNQPFFAMELVEGIPLTDYAKTHGLSLKARLELFIHIIQGVHHAHQKGVIHRDLKPANILVDRAGLPKILDFGVAKATGGGDRITTIETNQGALLGTLPYMSPEQAGGDSAELDTRSDLYSLGVIGYELLTERMPHDLDNMKLHEAVRVIVSEDPPRIGAFDRSLKGDLETILAKALEKEKARRYQSGYEFAADITRYLKNEPILARSPSAWYKVSKFARRNKILMTGITLLGASLIGGIAGTTIGLFKARDAA
ncbi:MAG: serine/threonine-protein kinase, partial [Verrucomicrobiota bacterium]